jgi:hypothetical protein
METIFIAQFEEIFKLQFKSIVNIEDMGADTDDNGIYHYVDMLLKDVYSFDTNDDVWLEKNLYKNEILLRLNIPF